MKLTRCCCCIQIKTGAYIIGSFHVIGLVFAILFFAPLKISLEVFCGCTFLYMVYKDSKLIRLLYFAAYVTYCAILAILHAVFLFWNRDEVQYGREFCQKVEEL